MNAIAVIPCRMAATRMPGKPMAEILGMPMVGHIYNRTKMAKYITDVYVATCDQEIFDYVESIGGKAIMTVDTHERATDRVGEAVEKIEADGGQKPDVVIMVQGDEPMIHPDTVDAMIEPFHDEKVDVANLINHITDDSEYENKDIVKLVADKDGKIIWFFRRSNPVWADRVKELPIKIQTGIIAFRRDALFKFNSLDPTMFEIVNSVDMCRFTENGQDIYVVDSDKRLISVDIPSDRDEVEERMKDDDLVSEYVK